MSMMPGQHSEGYRAAYASAIREAAALFRAEQPERWRQLLNDKVTNRATKAGGEG